MAFEEISTLLMGRQIAGALSRFANQSKWLASDRERK
jgi:hypothetical protein